MVGAASRIRQLTKDGIEQTWAVNQRRPSYSRRYVSI
jgi:hypothetical protein